MSVQRCLATLALFSSLAAARAPEPWTLARSTHFEVYSNAAGNSAPSTLAAFERLYAFFDRQVGAAPDSKRPVRVICFGMRAEYESFRLHSSADAFYLGTDTRDYIVMPTLPAGDFHLAAHEYAHLLIRSSGLSLPRWIAEGIAEVASTVQIRDRASSVGGDLPSRSRVLRTANWMPLATLFALGDSDARGQDLFYSQTWALTAMLLLSPEYGPRFRLLLGSLASGMGGEAALRAVYNRPPDNVLRDLHSWIARIPAPVPLPGIGALELPAQPAAVPSYNSRSVLADLRLALGDLDGAETMYRALAAERDSAEIYSALGLVALRKDNTPAALAAWQHAMELGISDPGICYRYAILADTHGVPATQVRSALERSIALQPDFDDARFKLALMEKNAGQTERAIAQLKAMRKVSAARAFSYWSAMADALLELGRRDEARAAALQASKHATSATERAHAGELVYIADTDLSVQLTSGPDGPHFRTIRVPHDQPPRNPFIESGDRIERVEASLKQIECADDGIRIAFSRESGDLTLAVPDPSRVQIRNSPGVSFEFTCGPQTPRRVLVEYTSTNVLRGIELR